MSDSKKYFKLPLSVSQPVDLNRLIHELTQLNEDINQKTIRNPNIKQDINISAKMTDVLKANNIDITAKEHRDSLLNVFNRLNERDRVINISFASEASPEFIAKITEWFRNEIDPYCFIVVGINPTIGVGCIARTTNRVFDMSLKGGLSGTRKLLTSRIRELDKV
jgi:F0F1-type ATP synthase delta subunit